ncbi:histidine kinase [Sedimentibacter sp.]|uniref:histidine kinase n=1 Tax=Sedimentibacter sp. TaxID=1960295 RepID=UPI0028A60F29|nr:histidine kinase [Sedimentibacter sp.]
MAQLLTRKDLAERWQVNEATIDNWRKEGVLTPCKGIPAPRFSEQHIAELEGIKLERFSPLERRRLEREIEELQVENTKLKGIISQILAASSQIISMKEGREL